MSWLKCFVLLMILAIVAPTTADAASRKRKKKKFTNIELENMFLVFDMGGGLYTYRYSVDGQSQNMKPGGTINATFQQFFYSGMGYGIGLGASYYGAATTFSAEEIVQTTDEFVHANDLWRGEASENYAFRTYFNSVNERQHLIQLEVPVMVMYKLKNMTEMWDFTVGLGAKLGVPLMKRYRLTDGLYETRGYFGSTNVEYNQLPQHKFTTIQANQTGKSRVYPITGSLLLDAGFNYHWERGKTLYLGLYFSYCVTNVSKGGNNGIIDVNNLSYKGVLGSTLVDNAHLLGAGAKVGLCLDFRRVKSIFKGGGSTRKINARSRRSVKSR